VIVGLAAITILLTAATGSASADSFAVTHECAEHQAFVDGDAAAVAARLPKRYTPVTDEGSGQPLLFVRAIHCTALMLDGHTVPVTMASFGIVIESPDGRGCSSGAPAIGSTVGDVPNVCNWYTLFWLADDPRVVSWLRDGTPGFPAVYVPNLVFNLSQFDPAQGGAPLHVEAPPPAPSPFKIDEIGRQRPGQIPIRGGYWADTAQGTVKLAFSTDNLTSGDATGTVHAAPGSEMAKLFGADDRRYVPGFSTFAAERWDTATYRKQLIGPARPGEQVHSFDGSCSLQGQVAFSPPVTNTPGPLTYTYKSTGDCTGKLDGRQVSQAPVTLEQSGHSYGTCPSAQTVEPGLGTIAFAGGEAIEYTLDFTDTGTSGDETLYGERSGTAGGQINFLTQRTGPDVVVKCSGSGLADTPMDMTVTTGTPLVSSQQQAKMPRLRVAARPRSARVGRRTTFRFLVTSAGRPVSGATVRFAGHSMTTSRAGAARVSVMLRGMRPRAVRASKPGVRAGRALVRIRR
jgi:hypothetical protein